LLKDVLLEIQEKMESSNSIATAGAGNGTMTLQETNTEKKLLVLKLREKCVKWDSDVVNNEFMGKKSSKRLFSSNLCLAPNSLSRVLYFSSKKTFR
jgi:hypothetical protein